MRYMVIVNVSAEAFLAGLRPGVRKLADAVLASCARRAVAAYAVGGGVRDLLLERPAGEADLVVVGPAIDVATEAAAAARARAIAHPQFGTATLRAGAAAIDVVTARRERYRRPGALPVVTPSTLEDDLARRDFTINAMAIQLYPPGNVLIDPHGGLADLRTRLIRTLHSASFRDDATRAFRAARYAARLGFAIEARTIERMRRDARYVSALSPARLGRELSLIFQDKHPERALTLCQDTGLLAACQCGLAWPSGANSSFSLVRKRGAPIVEFGFCLLLSRASAAEVDVAGSRLAPPPDVLRAFAGLKDLAAAPALARPSVAPSALVSLMDAVRPAAVAAGALVLPDEIARARCLRYLDEWRHVQPQIGAKDLVSMGFDGAAIGQGLRALRNGRLNGVLLSRDDELHYARELAAALAKPRGK